PTALSRALGCCCPRRTKRGVSRPQRVIRAGRSEHLGSWSGPCLYKKYQATTWPGWRDAWLAEQGMDGNHFLILMFIALALAFVAARARAHGGQAHESGRCAPPAVAG